VSLGIIGLLGVVLLFTNNLAFLLGPFFTNLGFVGLSRTIQQADARQRQAVSGEYWLQRALMQGQSGWPAYGLGQAYILQGRYAEAVQVLERGIEVQPENSLVHMVLANAYYLEGKKDEAIREWRISGAKPFLFNRGRQYERKGDWGKATYWYTAAASVDPNWAEPYYRLGLVRRAQGRVPEAIRYLKLAVSMAPDDPYMRHQLGLTYMSQGRAIQAIEQFEQVLRVLPDDLWTSIYLATLYLQQGRLDQAAYHAERAAMQSSYPRPHYVLGMVYYKQGLVERSIAEFEEAVRLASSWRGKPDLALSEVVKYHLALADAYRDAGQVQKARSAYKSVLTLDPTNRQAEGALQALGGGR
jgi:tetratricopeptide (TPR) repeat protein